MGARAISIVILALGLNLVALDPALAFPQMVDRIRFELELYADLTQLGGFPRAFQMTPTEGENGFTKGLYLTSGPVRGTASDRLFHIDEQGKVTVVKDGFNSTQTLVFARGQYGDGMLITEPRELRIQRLLPDGTISTFAELGTMPFGPSVLAYDPAGNLYVTDARSGNILYVKPDGTSEIFAKIPLTGKAPLESASTIIFDASGRYGGGFIAATFTGGPEPTDAGVIYLVSADGSSVEQLVNGLNGIELMTFGPGGVFGSDLFVASQGTDMPGDGAVYTMAPDGTLTPFIEGIDATHVVFDTEGILGGGMFVAELPNVCAMCKDGPRLAAGRIWHVAETQGVASGTVRMEFEDRTFDLSASLSNGIIQSIDVDPDFTSLVLSVGMSSNKDGTLEITLPRQLIDARTDGHDDQFTVLIDGEESVAEEKNTDMERTLRIQVPAGTEEIEIVGTQVIPEFPIELIALGTSFGALFSSRFIYRVKN